MLRKVVMVAAISFLAAACGTSEPDRALSGAGIGALGLGLAAGPVGALAGAGVGAATGAVTAEEDIRLGEPIWDDPTFWD